MGTRDGNQTTRKGEIVNRVRVLVWTGVALLALAVGVTELNSEPTPTVYSIMDQHEDCGSGGEDYAALERCLVERYDWPVTISQRFSAAIRNRHERDAAIDGPTDWDAFRRHAADLRAVYRALGVRDIQAIEAEIYADSGVTAFSDSIAVAIRDSVEQAWRRRQHAL
jgi:hypothetical protein